MQHNVKAIGSKGWVGLKIEYIQCGICIKKEISHRFPSFTSLSQLSLFLSFSLFLYFSLSLIFFCNHRAGQQSVYIVDAGDVQAETRDSCNVMQWYGPWSSKMDSKQLQNYKREYMYMVRGFAMDGIFFPPLTCLFVCLEMVPKVTSFGSRDVPQDADCHAMEIFLKE